MKNRKKNLYELLNVSQDARTNEIEDAFRRAVELYSGDSLAAYSLYPRVERERLFESITAAYETLKDPVKKSEYDLMMKQDHSEIISRYSGEDSGIAELMGLAQEAGSFRTVNLKRTLAAMGNSEPTASEQYRILYTRLKKLKEKDSLKTFAITSSVKGEGKTVTSLNLAYVIAEEFKKKCVILECDLRNPEISSNYLEGRGDEPGLVSVLKEEAELRDALIRISPGDNLYCLPARHRAANSSELLSQTAMEEIIRVLKEDFEYVIIDCPPIAPLADMNIISRLADGMILVIRAGKTPRDIVRSAVNSIKEGRFLGAVLNGCLDTFKGYYY
ncbi:MAG: polysaccharide biosynthesis tyrosine autokinase [Deltaproteobacteria bacterium]|nr:polysaccharide biosynthesis tyrosine autokinase [Deltaproteobacteria bacterium]